MQPYKLISGTTQNIGAFEQAISEMLEGGYALEGPLVTLGASGGTQLFQAMIADEDSFDDDEDEEEEEDEDG